MGAHFWGDYLIFFKILPGVVRPRTSLTSTLAQASVYGYAMMQWLVYVVTNLQEKKQKRFKK